MIQTWLAVVIATYLVYEMLRSIALDVYAVIRLRTAKRDAEDLKKLLAFIATPTDSQRSFDYKAN